MGNKIAVIYKSKYGATKRYAGWIALKLGADLYELSDIGRNDLKEYNTIIYGGPLYLEKIKGIKFIKNNYIHIKDKKVVIFMVGMKSFNENYINSILENNISKEILNNIEVFYFRGKIHYDELSIKDKILIFGLKTSALNIEQLDDKIILDRTNKHIDYIDKKSIDRLLKSIVISN